MNDVLIEGEPIELIQEAFRGMRAERGAGGWVSISGRLDPVPGEALLRALHRAETSLPRRLGTSREQHRAAALDEIARLLEVGGREAPRPERRERTRNTADAAAERFRPREPGKTRLTLVPAGEEPRT